MESDESRPGSSASNSTSSSVESNEQFENGSQSSSRRSRSKSADSNSSTSRDNSPESQNVNDHVKGPRSPAQPDNNDSQSRSISRASNQSDASNNSSDNDEEEEEENGSLQSGQNSNMSTKQVNRSRSQSISPTRQDRSRNSSVSSVPDAVNSSADRHDAINMSHEDLSDVSDLESAPGSPIDNNDKDCDAEINNAAETVAPAKLPVTDLRQKINEKKQENRHNKEINKNSPSIVDELNDIMDKKHDEDELDFEAEDGECEEKEDKPESSAKEVGEKNEQKKPDSDGEIDEKEELEEGEVSDEDEKRPEETEPKPVCRFYTRGQCTWGMSCRFLHPGVTDKGNYTMFDMIRPVPVNAHAPPFGPAGVGPAYHDFRTERPPIHHPMHFGNGGPPPATRPPIAEPIVESAWERGLRTAKEMMRKANKRKEQDMDFEDKKMNLSASQDELEKDNYYIRERSPELAAPPGYGARPIHHPGYSPPPPKYGIPPRAPMPYEHEDPYGRSIRYRELPPHRMPQYEEDMHRQKIRPAREVIVQRIEPVGRGDEWNDPWMRSKSPIREREKRSKRRSYSSNSSYSSSSDSSSKSGSSSNSSRSPSPGTRRRRFSGARPESHKSPVRGRHMKRSPTPEIHKRRGGHSPVGRRSPPKKRQPTPPIAEKRVTRSPLNKRKRASPPAPPPRKPISFSLPKSNTLTKRKRSNSSGSSSSGSSGSESDSSDSSSSSGSSDGGHKSRTRDKVVSERKMANKKVEAIRKRSPTTSLSQKSNTDGTATSSNKSSSSSAANSKKSTRREELLKQLRAVEDAIARKRSKAN